MNQNDPHIDCFTYIDYYISDNRLILKEALYTKPSNGREKITAAPLIALIDQNISINLSLDGLTWDHEDSSSPDIRLVSDDKTLELNIEHTKVSDSEQHFINQSLQKIANSELDSQGVGNNMLIRTFIGTDNKQILELCKEHSSWPETNLNSKNLDAIIQKQDKLHEHSEPYGLKLHDRNNQSPRIFLHDGPSKPLVELITESIEAKIEKYGPNSKWVKKTILLLDDETRAYTFTDYREAVSEIDQSLIGQFQGVYVIYFDGLTSQELPAWKHITLKPVQIN